MAGDSSDDSSAGSAAGGALGDVVSGIFGLFGANQENTAQSNLLNQQEAYNTQMADTQYQRSVADLKAAGLNPILAVGSQDASPTLPSYDVQNTMTMAANSAGDLGQQIQKWGQDAAETKKKKAEASSASTEAGTKKASQPSTIQKNVAEGNQASANAKVAETNVPAAQAEAKANTAESVNREKRAKVEKNMQQFDAYTKRFNDVADGLNSAVSLVKPLAVPRAPGVKNTVTEHYNSEGEHTGSVHRREY